MDTPELNELIVWLRQQLKPLIDSGDNWQVTLHGMYTGEVRAEVNRKQILLGTKKERYAQANGHNGYVRSVQTTN